MWRKQGDRSEIVDLDAGTCISIPLGTDFQFRALGFEPLAAIGLTMPNWPGADEAIQVEGCPEWTASPSSRQLAARAALSASIAALSCAPVGVLSCSANSSALLLRFSTAVRAAVVSPDTTAVRIPVERS